jgi:hypothetical protein
VHEVFTRQQSRAQDSGIIAQGGTDDLDPVGPSQGAAYGPVEERFHTSSTHAEALVCYLDVLGGHA